LSSHGRSPEEGAAWTADHGELEGEQSDDDASDGGDAPLLSALRHPDVTASRTGDSIGDSSASTDGVIAESLRESVEAADEWIFEKALEFMADVVHPGAGRLISIALKIRELLGDAEALASPDSSRNLHVPLLEINGGLAVDLNVHLPGGGNSGDAAPPVSGFLSPGDGGLFGGWAIEVERPESDKEASASGQDAQPAEAGKVTRPGAEQAGRSRDLDSAAAPVIEDDLSVVKRRVKDPWRRAVVLREAALRLRTRFYGGPGFAAQQIIVVYDPLAGLGMWLVKPDLSIALAGRRIGIWLDPVTGVTTVSIE
jgi:hypothetical protein